MKSPILFTLSIAQLFLASACWASCTSNMYDQTTVCSEGAMSNAYAAVRLAYEGNLDFDPMRPFLGAEYSPGGGDSNACEHAYQKALALAQNDCVSRNPHSRCEAVGAPAWSQNATYCGVRVYVK